MGVGGGLGGGGGRYWIKRLIQPPVTLACCLYNLRPYYCTLISSTVFHYDTLIYLIIISSWQWFWRTYHKIDFQCNKLKMINFVFFILQKYQLFNIPNLTSMYYQL